jgi:hypothetical protein
MKNIRIRHRHDKTMFLTDSGWSVNQDEARIFATPLEAIRLVVQQQIRNAELVVLDGLEKEIAVAV